MNNKNQKDFLNGVGVNKPDFGGSLEIAKINYLSHKWFQPNEYEPLYCASCDVRDYHKGAFYPCFVNNPKNGYENFTKEDFDNLTWDEEKRKNTLGVTHSVWSDNNIEIINFTEEAALQAVEGLKHIRKLPKVLKKMKSKGMLSENVENINWEFLHKLLEEE